MKCTIFPYSDTFFEMKTKIDSPQGFDVLVEIKAISVNPIDTKVKHGIKEGESRVLGWDASGIILEIGNDVHNFKVGDEVYYAGALNRSGSNTTHQLVDSRLIAFKPKTLSFEESASLPLTALTAYEGLFDRLGMLQDNNEDKSILIINGAGGVGSIAIQLAKYAGLKVIATASRKETIDWVIKMGADEVVNHHEDYSIEPVDYIYCLHTPDTHFKKMCEVIKPFGHICAIVDSQNPLDMNLLKPKSVSFSWEFMFTHSNYAIDLEHQGNILKKIAKLIDEGAIKTTLYQQLEPLSIKTLIKAHELIESNQSIGKLVISV